MTEVGSFKKIETVVEAAVVETRAEVVRDELLLLACLLLLSEREAVDDSELGDWLNICEKAYSRALREIQNEALKREAKP